MKIVGLLLAMAGVCQCLQAPLHYKYNYVGSAITGIPEMSNHAAGWFMKATVNVYLENDDGIAIFQLEDVKVAEFNDYLDCDFRGDIPDSLFHPFDDQAIARAVEAPFKAVLYNFVDHSIDYPKDGYAWLPNMRKGVAAIFKNEILRGNLPDQMEGSIAAALHNGKLVNIFSVKEYTMFGKCKVDYSIYPIPKYFAGTKNRELEHEITEDVQRPKSSPYTKGPSSKSPSKKSPRKSTKTKTRPKPYTNVPKLEDGLWHVIRSIDFDHCSDRAALQVTPMLFRKDVSVSQYKWARSRSSVNEYIFRGSAGHFRLEKAIVEGDTTKAPMGIKSELLQARVNQTLTLVSVTQGTMVPSLSDKLQQSKTWMYEVYSGAPAPKVSKPHSWIIYTGKEHTEGYLEMFGAAPLSSDEYKILKTSIFENVKSAAMKLTDVDQEDSEHGKPGATTLLHTSMYLFKSLSKANILEVFEHFFANSLHDHDVLAKKLVIDVAAASGSSRAYDAILDYIKEGKIPDLQIMTLFMALPNNAACPSSIPGILEYVMSLNIKEKPFLASTVLVNFAELVNQMCIAPNARSVHYTGPIFGDSGCNVDIIKNRFLPFLKDKIYNEESEWVQEIAIQTLWALGTPFSFPILAPVVEGRIKCTDSIRQSAIYALESWKFVGFENIKEQVADLLEDVYSDIGENLEVRIAAVTTAASWFPGASVWHRLARSTWREPSKHFATFATSLIESHSKLSDPRFRKLAQAAAHALSFAKPYAPSLKYSYITIMSSQLVEKHYSKFQVLNWLSNEDGGFNPKEIYYLLMNNFGGLKLKTLEVFASNYGFFEMIRDKIHKDEKLGKVSGIAAKVAQKFYDEIQETINAEPMRHDEPYRSEIFLRLFDHMHLILPINEETLTATGLLDPTKLAEFAIQLGLGHHTVLGKFFIPIDLISAHPTELGLPMFVHTSTPMTISEVSLSSLGYGGQSFNIDSLKKVEVSSEVLTSIGAEAYSSLQVLLPWSRKIVKTLAHSLKEVTLPLKAVMSRDHKEQKTGHQDIVRLEFSNLYKKKFDMVKAWNIPMTGIISVYQPLKDPTSLGLRPVVQDSIKSKVIHLPNKFTGIDATLTWKSKLGFPFTIHNLGEFISHGNTLEGSPWLTYAMASPTLDLWYATLEIDPAASKTKNITIVIETGVFGEKDSEEFTQQTGQEGQEASDYEQYSQGADDYSSQGFEDLGVPAEAESFSNPGYGDTTQQRSQKLQQHFDGTAFSRSLKIMLGGEEDRNYEVVYAYSKGKKNSNRKIHKSQISILRSPIPHVDDKSASICIDVKKATPAFSKLDTVESLLGGELDKVMEAEVFLDCKGNPVFTAKGTYHFTPEGIAKLKKEIPESCDYEPLDPLRSFHSHAVYDDLKVSLTWDKAIDSKRFPLTSSAVRLANGAMYVHFHDEDCVSSGGESKLEVDIHRCPKTGNWYLDLEHKNSEVHLESVPHNCVFDYLFHAGKRGSNPHSDISTTSTSDSEKCYIGLDAIRTFDGLVYDYHPTTCWTVAAKDCYHENGWILLVRAASGESTLPEAKFVDVERGLAVEYSDNVVKVNGKTIDPVETEEVVRDSEGRILVAVEKKNDFFRVKFYNKFYVSLKNKIEIHVPDAMKGHMCGLCGDYNKEKDDDLVGPHRCFFEDTKLFENIWTGPSDSCDLYTLLELRDSAEKFQKTCDTIESLHDHCPHFNERCAKYEWMVQKEGTGESCVSVNPLPHCEEGCKTLQSEYKSVAFRCWPDAHAPEAISAALAKGEPYITTPIAAEAYHEDVYHHLTIPTVCKNY